MKKIFGIFLCALFSCPQIAHAGAVFYAQEDGPLYAVIEEPPAQIKVAANVNDASFIHRQEYLASWVKDINYRTRVGLTERDRRPLTTVLNVITLGLSSVFMEELTQGWSTRIVKFFDKDIEYLKENAEQDFNVYLIPRVTLEQLYQKIKQKPFLLLYISEEEFNELCKLHPKVEQLFNNMYIFFHHRSDVLGEDFNQNIEKIERISRAGKDDVFKTWELLAQYTLRELETAKQEKLALQSLEYLFTALKQENQVDKEVRRILRKKGVIPSKQEMRKKRRPVSVRQKALQIIQQTPQEELIEKYMED